MAKKLPVRTPHLRRNPTHGTLALVSPSGPLRDEGALQIGLAEKKFAVPLRNGPRFARVDDVRVSR